MVASPWILVFAFALVLVIWLLAVLAGYRGPASLLVNVMSVPPVSTWSVDVVPSTLAGGGGGPWVLVAAIGTVVVRALIHAAFVGLIVDELEGGAASPWSMVRGLRAFPTTLAVGFAGFMLLTVGAALGPLLGGLSLLVLLGALVFGVYLFAYAPVAAMTRGLGALGALSTSMRAARMPGSNNITIAALYALPSIVLLLIPKPGSSLGVNPSVAAWVLVLVGTLAHLAFLGAFVYRYLSVADETPDPPERKPALRGRR